jgi:hypothetical protein
VVVDARAADAAGLPTTVLPCIPSDSPDLLAADDGTPVLCWDTGCALVDAADDPKLVARPPARAAAQWRRPVATVRDDGGHLAACAGPRCQPLGRRLATQIDHETRRIAEMIRGGRDDLHPVELQATDDLETVTIDGEAWGVRADRKLALAPPKGTAKDSGPGLAHVAANHLVVEWKPCAGPCAFAAITDSLAKKYGTRFEAGSGIELVQLDDDRFVAFSDTGAFTVVELRTGKLVGSLTVPGYPFLEIGQLDDLTFGVVAHDGGYLRLTSVDLSGEPRAHLVRLIPRC